MSFRDRAYAIVERVFADRIDEGATLEIAARKPLSEQGEESDDSLTGITYVGKRQLGIEPLEPSIALAFHDRAHTSFFRSNLIIDRPAGYTCFPDDLFD